jgi:hypothetical protein
MKKAYLHNIKYAINKGFRLVIRDGEDGELLTKTYGYKEAKEAIESVDFTYIKWQRPTTETEQSETGHLFKTLAVFAVILDYDQEPEETISDYGVNEYSEAWSDAYDKECYQSAEKRLPIRL